MITNTSQTCIYINLGTHSEPTADVLSDNLAIAIFFYRAAHEISEEGD